jgi:hypothetical protein
VEIVFPELYSNPAKTAETAGKIALGPEFGMASAVPMLHFAQGHHEVALSVSCLSVCQSVHQHLHSK